MSKYLKGFHVLPSFKTDLERYEHIKTISTERVNALRDQINTWGNKWHMGKYDFIRKTYEQNRIVNAIATARIHKIKSSSKGE